MALVLQTKETVGTGDKLYRDALVSNGTLMMLDFSNRGTLHGFSLKRGFPIRDLSGFPDVNNDTRIVNSSDLNISEGLGFPLHELDTGEGSSINLGKDLLNYLHDNENNEFMFVFWLRRDGNVSGSTSTFINSSDDSNYMIRSRISIDGSNRVITTTVGDAPVGVRITDEFNNGDIVQAAVHYRGVGEDAISFKNSQQHDTSTRPSAGFGVPESDLLIGRIESGVPFNMYRIFMEDLTVSGRNAEDVIQEDWEYNNAIGKYSYMKKRPFIDTL